MTDINEYRRMKADNERQIFPKEKVEKAFAIMKDPEMTEWIGVLAGRSNSMSLTDALNASARYKEACAYIADYKKFIKKYKKPLVEQELRDIEGGDQMPD